MSSRGAERRANFKKTVDDQDGRRRREETTQQIRKNKKEESLRKRRMMTINPSSTDPIQQQESTMSSTSVPPSSTTKKNAKVSDIPELKRILISPASTEEETLEATRGFRRLLSVERDPPVHEVLAAGVLPILVKNLVANPTASTLIFETAWALTNIASTSETLAVVEGGAVQPLIQLLHHANADVREQAAWCLGNIAGDNTDFRDHLLNEGIINSLLLNILQPANMSLLNNVVWTVSNLCRGKPNPSLHLVEAVIQPLVDLLHKEVTVDVLVDVVWALSYISDGANERIDRVLQTGAANKLVEFLAVKESPLLTPTIRCLGNFVTGTDIQTQAVVDAGILEHLGGLLKSTKRSIRKESCWLASNIAAGTHPQINALMHHPGVMGSLVSNAIEASWDVRKEALWAISNICTTGSEDQVQLLVQCEGLEPLAEILSVKSADANILCAALDGIKRVLEVGERHSRDYGRIFDEYNGIEHLEELQEHVSDAVYKKTITIIENFFGAEDEEDENLAPATTAAGTFEFGISSPKQLFPTSGMETASPVIQFGGAITSNRAT